MPFLNGLWRILMGVKDVLVLLFLVLFFVALWGALSLRAPGVKVPDGGLLVIDLRGTLVDQATPSSPFALLAGDGIVTETEARDVVRAIDRAATDKAIRGIVLDLDGFLGGGLANLEGVGAALLRFRATEKPVFAFATGYADSGYLLAAHATESWVDPMGGVFLSGPGGTGIYLKGALEKLKVDVEVFRVGTFKSASEPFTEERASPEARAADQALVDDLWLAYQASVARAKPGFDVRAAVEAMPARVAGRNSDLATLAVAMGFVDKVGTRRAFVERLEQEVGEGDVLGIRGITLSDYLSSRFRSAPRGDHVGIIHVAGGIVDGQAPEGQAGGESVRDLLLEAIDDKKVKAIVVRIDSGGGTATASDVIRETVLKARAEGKPVVASMGPVAASGGYWVATGAEKIFAEPSTITGSIGVVGILPTFGRTLAEVGITTDGVGTTPYSRQPNVLGQLNDPARELIQAGVRDVYGKFIAVVAEARGMDTAAVEAIAEGRVWSGQKALELNLIDTHGGLDAAVAEAARLAGIEGEPESRVIRKPRSLLAQLLEQGALVRHQPMDPLAAQVMAARMQAAAMVQATLALLKGPAIHAACVACAAFRPVSAEPPAAGIFPR
ncbi:MAG: signal peptide peptidase SppA [Sphingomonadaceae bacterium]